ncbi:MAG: phosphoenolpyruvate carboxykinase, partial [Vallitaleaceae bacterium]|nr:phosphoenolpyruvate carboxykinase [Vallitaleaceae bacterium]
MASKANLSWSEIAKSNPIFSQVRATIEPAFYGNNVQKVTLQEAYKLAAVCPGTVITDIPVFEPEKSGLEPGTKVLLFNDGNVSGRAAAA